MSVVGLLLAQLLLLSSSAERSAEFEFVRLFYSSEAEGVPHYTLVLGVNGRGVVAVSNEGRFKFSSCREAASGFSVVLSDRAKSGEPMALSGLQFGDQLCIDNEGRQRDVDGFATF